MERTNNLNVEIYIEDDSETGNLTKRTRGYRRDVFVKYQEKIFKMNVFSFVYLNQFLKNQYELEKIYFIESNLLIVKNVEKKDIIDTVLNNASWNYFDNLKECKTNNGEIFYPLDELTVKSHKEKNWPISIQVNKLVKIY